MSPLTIEKLIALYAQMWDKELSSDVGFSCVVHDSSERRVSRTISAAMLFTSKDFAAGADGGSIAASLTPYR
jgi:hypothetical protein